MKGAAKVLNCLQCGKEFWASKPEHYCDKCRRLPNSQLKKPTDNSLEEEW